MITKPKNLLEVINTKPLRILKIEDILKNIPHRYPFLLVDRVNIIEEKKYVTGTKCVTINEPFFKGHFPEKPVMPAVLIIEAMAQTCAAMVMDYPEFKGKIAYFMGIEKAKFRRPVVPGDTLKTAIEILRLGKMGKCFAQSYVDDDLVSEAQMSFITE